MEAFNTELFLSTLALIGVVIAVSALLSGFIERSGLPQVAVFLALGAVIGPYGLKLTDVNLHSPYLRVVATLSLVLVLFTDAVSLNLTEVRRNKLLSLLVVGPGTLFSALLIALLGSYLLGLPAAAALILGAALASTDPVMLRALLSRPGVDGSVRQALRLEGGMNDAVLLPLVILGMTLLEKGRSPLPSEWAHLVMSVLLLSPAVGVIVALAAVGMLELVRKRSGVRRDYESIYSLGVAFAAYAVGDAVGGSGFLSAFAAGLTISALDVELCDCFLEYGETTAEMALMLTFVLFGMSLIWSGLSVVAPVTLLFVFLVFAARPFAFLPALLPTRLEWKNRWIIAYFGPRGLSSLLLVMLPVFANLAGSQQLLTICCLVVLFSVLVHGLTPGLLFRPTPPAETPAQQPARAEIAPAPVSSLKVLEDTPDSGEFITVAGVEVLQRRNSDILIVDARSDRSYDESSEEIPDSFRVNPQFSVRSATALRIPKTATLAVLCA